MAIRFYKLFQLGPKSYSQKAAQAEPTGRSSEEKLVSYDLSQEPAHPTWVKILRFYAVIEDFLNVDDPTSVRMAFNFYDYDNNGNIGSVDIINLKRHFTPLSKVTILGGFQSFETLLTAFEEERIKRNVKESLKFVLKGSERKALIVRAKPRRKEYNHTPNVTHESAASSSGDEDKPESDSV